MHFSLREDFTKFYITICVQCNRNPSWCQLLVTIQQRRSKIDTSSIKLRYTVGICIIQYHCQYITINRQLKYCLSIFFSISLKQNNLNSNGIYSKLLVTAFIQNCLSTHNRYINQEKCYVNSSVYVWNSLTINTTSRTIWTHSNKFTSTKLASMNTHITYGTQSHRH